MSGTISLKFIRKNVTVFLNVYTSDPFFKIAQQLEHILNAKEKIRIFSEDRTQAFEDSFLLSDFRDICADYSVLRYTIGTENVETV